MNYTNLVIRHILTNTDSKYMYEEYMNAFCHPYMAYVTAIYRSGVNVGQSRLPYVMYALRTGAGYARLTSPEKEMVSAARMAKNRDIKAREIAADIIDNYVDYSDETLKLQLESEYPNANLYPLVHDYLESLVGWVMTKYA